MVFLNQHLAPDGYSRGPQPKVSLYKLFHYMLHILYTGIQWKMLPIDKGPDGKAEIHYTRVWTKWKQWVEQDSIDLIFYQSIQLLQEHGYLDLSLLHADGSNVIAKKGGDEIGYCGYKHQKASKVVSIEDNAGHTLAPMTISPVNETDMVHLPEALRDLTYTVRLCRLPLAKGTPINVDPGFDSKKNRKIVWNAGLKPNIKENKRNRKKTKRGRKRFFDKELYKKRFQCERTFAWQDKFKRVLVKCEWYQHMYLGVNLLAFALINFRHFHS